MGRHRKPEPEKFCPVCGARLQRKMFNGRLEDMGSFMRRKYCNQVCMAEVMEGVIKVQNEKNYRRQSQKIVKNNCEMCGRSDNTLYVHHIDENPINNDPLNLQTLCGSCHRQAHSPNFAGIPGQRKQCLYCSNPAMKSGLCWTHNTRRKKYGDPLLTKTKIGSEWCLVREVGR